MLYGSVTWCICQKEIVILQRTERAMVRSMCEVTLMDKKSAIDAMQMLDLNEEKDMLARSNSIRWYGRVLSKDMNNFLTSAFDFRV